MKSIQKDPIPAIIHTNMERIKQLTGNQYETMRNKAAKRAVKFATERSIDLIGSVPIEWSDGAQDAFLQARSEGKFPVLLPSHQTHFDVTAATFVNKELMKVEAESQKIPADKRLRGFILTTAASAPAGHQGKLIEYSYGVTKDILRKQGTQLLEIVRPDDVERYGMSTNSVGVTREMIRGIHNQKGISVFLEGGVNAGRKINPEKEEIPIVRNKVVDIFNRKKQKIRKKLEAEGFIPVPVNGMQRFRQENLNTIIKTFDHTQTPIVFIPVAIDGVHRLIEPTYQKTNRIPLRGALAIAAGRNTGLIHLTIGTGISLEDIVAELPNGYSTQDIADYLGRRVAALLPENKQGVYKTTK